jgi:hypothetical protein
MFNTLDFKDLRSFHSPKIGEIAPTNDKTNFIRILNTLPLTDTKTLIIFSKTTSKYDGLGENVPEYIITKYYGKIWETALSLGDVEENSFFIDSSVIYSYYDFQINYYGDGHLTSGIKAQITPDNQILITWLKAEIDYEILNELAPPPLI